MARLKSPPRQGSPVLAGKYSYSQLQDLWIQNGGNPIDSPVAAAIAMAESGGDPNATNHNTNGSTDRGLWQINSVHGAQSTYDVNANARAAVAISSNGNDWSPWVTYQNGAYKQFLAGRGGTVNHSQQGLPGGSSSSGSDPSGGGGLSVLQILSDLLTGNISDLASQMAIAGVTVIKDLGLGIADWIIIPWWHWNQRAAQYYVSNELFSNDNSKWSVMPWTATFWGVGYWLFWTDPESGNLKPAPVRNSRTARHVRALQSLPARRSLIKPKDVKNKTSKKPRPVVSRAVVMQTGTMRVTRNVPVRVTGTHVDGKPGDNGRDNAKWSGIPIKRAGTVGATQEERNRFEGNSPATKSRPVNRARSYSSSDSRRPTQDSSKSSQDGRD